MILVSLVRNLSGSMEFKKKEKKNMIKASRPEMFFKYTYFFRNPKLKKRQSETRFDKDGSVFFLILSSLTKSELSPLHIHIYAK